MNNNKSQPTMPQNRRDDTPDVECTWKNCLIWAPILAGLAALIRVIAWYLAIYMGSVDIFSDYFCWTSLATYLFSLLIPTVSYIWCYAAYMKKGKRNPTHLQELANGGLGKLWLAPMIGLILMEGLYLFVSTLFITIGCELSLDLQDDFIVFRTYLLLGLLYLPGDLILFFLGKQLFLPSAIQKH